MTVLRQFAISYHPLNWFCSTLLANVFEICENCLPQPLQMTCFPEAHHILQTAPLYLLKNVIHDIAHMLAVFVACFTFYTLTWSRLFNLPYYMRLTRHIN